MEEKLFGQLVESLQQALEHAQGKRVLKTTVFPGRPEPMSAADIKAMRKRLNVSQSVLAYFLNVSTKLVQAWESGQRKPQGAALKLLRLGCEKPELVFETLQGTIVEPK